MTKMTKKEIIKSYVSEYKKADKINKTNILNILVKQTKLNRKYLIFLLNNHGKKIYKKNHICLVGDITLKKQVRNKPKIYDKPVKEALMFFWTYSGFIDSKRLQAILPTLIDKNEESLTRIITDEVKQKLLKISHGTIDNLLREERRKNQFKGISHTKPGTFLKQQIPIRTFADWNEKEIGFTEIDLVGHDGGSLLDDFCYTLTLVDVNSGWIDIEAIKNKAMVSTVSAVENMRKRLPFKLKGIDTDNGSEFINNHLKKYCEKHKITFTRGRSYRKNDNCFVEQKNYDVVRKFIGYYRFDTAKELELLNEMYKKIRLIVNFFRPSVKLIKKERIGSKVRKYYDKPKTPYERILNKNDVDEKIKNKLINKFNNINPFILMEQLTKIQKKLLNYYKRKIKKIKENPEYHTKEKKHY